MAMLRRCSDQSAGGEAPFSVAVRVGIIALAGVAAETGVVMLVYLDEVSERRIREGRMTNGDDLREAIMEGAVQRVRPKMMTVAAIMGSLLPIMLCRSQEPART
ncbi:MAG: efflux RND transporter permease subunit [Nitrospira sp.]|nr:efflux RND transporter permease subunit [Nitrospira sp.]